MEPVPPRSGQLRIFTAMWNDIREGSHGVIRFLFGAEEISRNLISSVAYWLSFSLLN
jgi:hypothetical protein